MYMYMEVQLVPRVYNSQDNLEQLWFPLNEIHQPQLLRVNQGKLQLQTKQLMGRAGVIKPPKHVLYMYIHVHVATVRTYGP